MSKKGHDMNRISTAEAATRLGISPQALRVWIEQKGDSHPFGAVIREKSNRYGRNTYFINEQRLESYLQGKQ